MKLNKYEKHIECAEKYSLYGPANTKIYVRLQELRKLRNRIHIQNKHGNFEPDEAKAFTFVRKRQAERTTEFILRYSSIQYGRPKHCYHVANFSIPWEHHFTNTQITELLA